MRARFREKPALIAALSLALAVLALPPRLAAGTQEAEAEPPEALADTIRVALGELVENIACLNDRSQTYTLYLPSSYTSELRRPVLFIFDPRGRSVMAAEIFRVAAERYGWILMSSDNTRSDGPWEPNLKALNAMEPDMNRYAVDADRIYAAGFSGGALLAWIWGQQGEALAGVITSGGRPVRPSESETKVPFAHFGAAGDEEFNYEPTRELDETAARLGAPHRFESFPGPHAWMPADLALEAVEWMEIQAMRSGTRTINSELAAELYRNDLDRARELEDAGDLLKAQRRFESIARTFEGVRSVEEASARAAALAESPEVEEALEEETSARAYEQAQRLQIARTLNRLRAPSDTPGGVVSVRELEFDLRLSALLQTSREETVKGFAARRALASLSVQLSFYLPRDFFQAQDYTRAAVALELVTRIGPARPFVLYNLASAWARSGRAKKALSALTDAVEAGYSDVEYMQQDADLESLRKLGAYQDLVARMKAAG